MNSEKLTQVRADLAEVRAILIRQGQTDFIPGVDGALVAVSAEGGLGEARAMLQSMYAGAGSLSDFYAVKGDAEADNARFDAAIARLWSALDC